MQKLLNPSGMSRGAMVIAVIALIAALGGSAYAGAKLGKNSVKTKQIANGAVTSAKLGKGAVASKVKFTRVEGPKLVVAANKSESTTISCPAGSIAVSGGAEVVNPTNTAELGAIISSFQVKSNPNQWTIRVEANATSRSWETSVECVTLS